tara:strand:+ start:12224 stop:12994 length:771 start_codon:yes stop_codon:yes gene_type:complete
MKTYLIYRHYFHNHKSYIGWTDKGINERLRVHETDALLIEKKEVLQKDRRKFHKAILKYSIENIKSEVLEICNTENEAKEREIYWISFFNSYKKGYNMTTGGDGGNCISHILNDPIKKEQWGKDISERTTGLKNPNSSGFTDQELIQIGKELYLEYGYWSHGNWTRLADKIGLPKSMSKNRFGGKFSNFRTLIANELDLTKLEPYKITKEHKQNLSKSASKYGWVTNKIENKMVLKEEIESYINQGFSKGRTLKKD